VLMAYECFYNRLFLVQGTALAMRERGPWLNL